MRGSTSVLLPPIPITHGDGHPLPRPVPSHARNNFSSRNALLSRNTETSGARAGRKISRDWAKRVILVVGEREARLQAAEVFRGREPPRFVCPLCHEFGCSTADGLDEHLRETTWHEVNAALQVGYGNSPGERTRVGLIVHGFKLDVLSHRAAVASTCAIDRTPRNPKTKSSPAL